MGTADVVVASCSSCHCLETAVASEDTRMASFDCIEMQTVGRFVESTLSSFVVAVVDAAAVVRQELGSTVSIARNKDVV